MTSVAILQPSYLPWIGYFDQIDRADIFVFYDDVQYDKHGWRNRNRLKGPAGPVWITVPVLHSGRFGQLINAVEIDRRQDWGRKHVLMLSQLYARAPHSSDYLPELSDLMQRDWARLSDLAIAATRLMARWFGIAAQFHLSSELCIPGERSERLLAICRRFGADRYISGDAAQAYLDVDRFRADGIDVVWQNYRHPEYPQRFGAFVPYLSAIDLLCNAGRESLTIIRRGRASLSADSFEVTKG
ncbi:MAG TPA: WbqC family protein [Xanthobacteraceae bacterium]|nr:WbqC family protein [Xanthobacteraceae bacterium]